MRQADGTNDRNASVQSSANSRSHARPTPDRDGETAHVRHEVASVLNRRGVLAALGYLNARVRCRYTGIFRPEPPRLRNIRLYDRENPTIDVSGIVIELNDGYCGLTCASAAPFATSDSRRDPRLRAHPARESMRSYAGVPLRIDDAVWGTLCHYDMRPRVIPRGEVTVLEHVAPLFAQWVREYRERE